MQAHRRHDISDAIWENIKPYLSGRKGSVGKPASNNRRPLHNSKGMDCHVATSLAKT